MRHAWAATLSVICLLCASPGCELASGLNKLHTPSESVPDASTSPAQTNPSVPARDNVPPESQTMNAQTATSGQGADADGSASVAGAAGMRMGTPPPAADTTARSADMPDASVGVTPENEPSSMSGSAGTPAASTSGDGMTGDGSGMSGAAASDMNAGSDNMSDPDSMGAPAAMMHASEMVDAGTMPTESSDMTMSSAGTAGPSDPPADPQCTPSFPGASCDTAPQCGCAEGENCAYLSVGFPTCLRAGSARLNQPCLLATDCQPGLQCLDGACLQLCDPNVDSSCDNARACGQIYQSGRAIPGYYTCSSDCNLAAPQAQSDGLATCGPGLICVWYGEGGTACGRPHESQATHGERCEDNFDCGAGYTCLTGGTCGKWCRDSRDCPSNFYCEETSVTVRETAFGLCRPNCAGPRDQSCQVHSQCGCEGGMACDYLSRSDDHFAPACRPRGSVSEHYGCDSVYDCAAGTSCTGGRCSQFCFSDSDCGDVYAKCEQVTNSRLSGRPPIPDFLTCTFPCDPANLTRPRGAYDACPSTYPSCAPTTDGRSYCHIATSEAAWGDRCNSSNDCAVGDICTGSGCAPMCRSNSDCPSGSVCYEFSPRLFAGSQQWGACFTPQQ